MSGSKKDCERSPLISHPFSGKLFPRQGALRLLILIKDEYTDLMHPCYHGATLNIYLILQGIQGVVISFYATHTVMECFQSFIIDEDKCYIFICMPIATQLLSYVHGSPNPTRVDFTSIHPLLHRTYIIFGKFGIMASNLKPYPNYDRGRQTRPYANPPSLPLA